MSKKEKNITKVLAVLLSMLMAFSIMPLSVFAAENKKNVLDSVNTIAADETITVEVAEGGTALVAFTPAVFGQCEFTSNSDSDTYGYLYDADMKLLTSDDDSGNGSNFKITYSLTAGKTYYFGCSYYSSVDFGNYDVTLSFTPLNATKNGLIYAIKNGEAIITGYTEALSGNTVIPDTIDGYPVTAIGGYAFIDCDRLKSVTIPDSIIAIGEYAFIDCDGLTSVTIPDSVTAIGNHAFSDCYGLTSITISHSITAIGEYVFSNCSRLTDVIIPDSVTTVGALAFAFCDRLTSVMIPGSVTTIGDSAFFYCSRLTSVEIPDSVTVIGDSAFDECSGLKSVTIGNSVTTIGNYAFDGCSGLKSMTIPDSVTAIGDFAFRDCSGLTSVTIGNSVTTIGDSAFICCDGLTNITIPDSVTTIGNSAFESCIGLTGFTVAEDNENYSSDAYGVLFNKEQTMLIAYPSGNMRKEYTIPAGVTTIDNKAFFDCCELTSVTISDSVTTIGDAVFYGCYGLTSVTIPDSVTTIGDYAFFYCYGLPVVAIPAGVTTIGNVAFMYCSGLTSVTLSDRITTIGDSAFMCCSGLTNVTIPDSVTTIGDSAFRDCSGLTSVTLPNSVKTIGYEAFCGCDGLTGATIPDRVDSIGVRAFGYSWDDDVYEYKTIDGFTICGYANSTAETYANENGFDFVKLKHDYVKSITKEATCTGQGEALYTCTVCGNSYTAVIPARGHEPEVVSGKAATCTEKGLTDGSKCSVCGEILKAQAAIPAKGHDYAVITENATCTADGSSVYTCSACGDSYTEMLPAHGHKSEVVSGKAVTCTEKGLTDGSKCAVCGEILNAQIEIPATGHADDDMDSVCDHCGTILGLVTVSADNIKVTETGVALRPNMVVDEIKSQLKNENVNIVDKDGKTIAANGKVGTGSKIQLVDGNGNVVSEYEVIVLMDVNGDGSVTAADARIVLRHSAKLDKLEGAYKAAADINGDAKITAASARKILRVAAKLDEYNF